MAAFPFFAQLLQGFRHQHLEFRKPEEVSHMKAFFIAVGLSFALPAAAQQDFSKVEIKAEKLSDTVYMLPGAGGNIGLSIGEEAVLMVDDQFAPLTPKIQEAIGKLTPKPV